MAQASTVKSTILDLFTVKPTYSQGEMRKMEIMCTTTAKPSLFLSRSMMTNSSVTQNAERAVILIFSIGGGLILLFLVIVVTCLIRRSKDLKKVTDDNKVELGSSLSSTPDSQHLLPSDRKQNDTSMTSSDSHSQPESSSDLTDDCVSSPVVNLSITATFNCHLSPGMHTCSHLPPKAETLVPFCSENIPPLSQEEASTLCQQEDGKDALCSVQESGIVL
ncbi:hypothetical protein DNTS_014013 [Danionella cerebrum]|uniref:Uncharacterized protein n=1 Tax=Danionella cerebrum TaxID=2873325 RepID=A0A553N5E4_9TELE|nr:hypothetical protein DNTS_014013 [Danionella translucida]